jgi:hypothetical protein
MRDVATNSKFSSGDMASLSTINPYRTTNFDPLEIALVTKLSP